MSRRPRVVEWQIAVRDHPTLSARARHLGLLLATYMAADSLEAYPSLDTLAEKCARSRNTVLRARAELVEAGLLAVKRGGGRGRSTVVVGVLETVAGRAQYRAPKQSHPGPETVAGRAQFRGPKQLHPGPETVPPQRQEHPPLRGDEHDGGAALMRTPPPPNRSNCSRRVCRDEPTYSDDETHPPPAPTKAQAIEHIRQLKARLTSGSPWSAKPAFQHIPLNTHAQEERIAD